MVIYDKEVKKDERKCPYRDLEYKRSASLSGGTFGEPVASGESLLMPKESTTTHGMELQGPALSYYF